MNYYEILYIVNPNFERKKIDDAMKEIENRLKKTKSKIINHIIWGKKKLAYPIQDHKYGTYIMAHYNGGDKSAIDEFNSWLRLSDLVIRHMTVRLDSKPEIIEKGEDDLKLDTEKEGNSGNEEKSIDKKDELVEVEENVDEEKEGVE
tara:strand:+ start:89 stop:529 length:441 start_codon:yes stop_codon:yes gene_type:complete